MICTALEKQSFEVFQLMHTLFTVKSQNNRNTLTLKKGFSFVLQAQRPQSIIKLSILLIIDD